MRPALVLAANLETLIGVAFVVISLISGLMNYLNSRAKPNGPNRPGAAGGRPVRPRSERIQSEIEQFMRDQVRRQDGDPAAARSQPENRSLPENRPQPEKPAAPARQMPQRRAPAPRGPAPRPARKLSAPLQQQQPINVSGQSSPLIRPGDDITNRKSIASGSLGQSLREHLQTSMVERVQSGAQSHLGHKVSSDVTRHLGTFMGGASVPPALDPIAGGASALTLASELRSRDGMRKALIAQIVLERPAALRRR